MSTDDERQARLAQIRARLEDATPGPWYINQLDDEWSMSFVGVGTSPDDGTGDYAHHCYETLVAATLVQQPRYVDHADGRWDENAALIANAPDDLAWLLAELDAATARAKRAERAYLDIVAGDAKRFHFEDCARNPDNPPNHSRDECVGGAVDMARAALAEGA